MALSTKIIMISTMNRKTFSIINGIGKTILSIMIHNMILITIMTHYKTMLSMMTFSIMSLSNMPCNHCNGIQHYDK